MGINFKIKDFAHPLRLLRTKRSFDAHQYLSPSELGSYQLERFATIVAHAGKHVPYYRSLFDRHGLSPSQVESLADGLILPRLTKSILAESYTELVADNARRYKPQELRTSGTTGRPIRFLVDKTSNALEFAYYWRFWGWHGYNLGMRFAELSAEAFIPIEENRDNLFRFNPFLNRLLVNSLALSRSRARDYIALLEAYRPLFLKGLPSNLYALALLCRDCGRHDIKFRAIFAQGENLHDYQRRLIEQVFSSRIYDSYGHLERTVAISQCQHGSYHVHSDYGFAQFEKPQTELSTPVALAPGQALFEVIGTSLHNLAMPLIRYRTGDLVIIDSKAPPCLCGRPFPVVHSIVGRDTDIVVTPDRRAITALYVALAAIEGLACSQIIQESLDTLVVKVAHIAGRKPGLDDATIVRAIHAFTGDSMRVVVRNCELDEIHNAHQGKFKAIVSLLDPVSLLK